VCGFQTKLNSHNIVTLTLSRWGDPDFFWTLLVRNRELFSCNLHVKHCATGSTEDFFSKTLNQYIGHGDLLSNRGVIVKTNQELLSNFSPIEDLADFGLDAVVVRPGGEIWFSVEFGFTDPVLGPVSDGDMLSDQGYIVARNQQLLEQYKPVELLDNFGLDALTIGIFDVSRYDYFPAGFGGDVDGDGSVDLRDFGMIAEWWQEHYDLIDLVHLARQWLE